VEDAEAEIHARVIAQMAERERLALESIANASVPLNQEAGRGPIVMGKQKKALETSLDYGER